MPTAISRAKRLVVVPRLTAYPLHAARTSTADDAMRVQSGILPVRSAFTRPKANPPKSSAAHRMQQAGQPDARNGCHQS